MEEIIKCNMLKAIFREKTDIKGGSKTVEFKISRHTPIHVRITQERERTIVLTSDTDVPVENLYKVFSRLERLLMLFDGRFIPLHALEFSDSSASTNNLLLSYSRNCLNNRLSYFQSIDFCRYDFNRLLDFETILSADLYEKWEKLLEDLDIVHQMFLYSLCDGGQPIDIKCSFLIELSEPLVEIVKTNKHYFSSLTPGDRNTSLKNCLDALITKYGEEIFEDEISDNYEKFLQAMVNSRVRIMHIKRTQRGLYLNGKESVLYTVKMYLLYRRVVFEILNIDYAKYETNLKSCVASWNNWNDILKSFLLKLN